MEFKWLMIGMAVIMSAGAVALAVDSNAKAQIGVECVRTGNLWVNNNCVAPTEGATSAVDYNSQGLTNMIEELETTINTSVVNRYGV